MTAAGTGTSFAGVAAGLGAALAWSSGGLVVKSIDLPPLEIAAVRGLVSALFFLAIGHRTGLAFRGWTSWAYLSATGLAVTVLGFVVATKWTTAAAAIFLQSTAPFWVLVIGALFLGHRPGRTDLLAVAGCGLGLSLFFVGKLAGMGFLGNLLGLVTGVSFGLYQLSIREVPKALQFSVMTAGNGLCAILAVALACSGVADAVDVSAPVYSTPTVDQWLGLLYLGAGQIGLGYCLFLFAVRRLPALQASLLTLLEPVLNPVWVYMGNGESPGVWAILGGAIVLASLAVHSVVEHLGNRTKR